MLSVLSATPWRQPVRTWGAITTRVATRGNGELMMLKPAKVGVLFSMLALAACSSDDPLSSLSQPGIDAAAMDLRVDPCDDFFQYACGQFIASNPLGDHGAVISRRSTAFFATEKVERAIVTEPSSTADPDTAMLRSYFGACSSAGPGGQDRKDLDDALAQIDAIAGPDDLARVVASLHTLGADALFWLGSTRDLNRPDTRIAYVDQGGIGLPDRSYYLDASMPWLDEYRAHIGKLSSLVGVNDPEMPEAVVKIETQLATAMLPYEELRDPAKSFHLQDLAAFEASVPGFSWPVYLEAAGAPAFSSLDVTVPQFFAGLEGVLKNTEAADLKRYLRFRVIEAFANTLGDDVVAEEYDFHFGVFYGFSTPLPRPEYCLRHTAGALPWPMSRAYVARAFSEDAIAEANDLMDDTRAAFQDNIEATTWLDDKTRDAALAKLDAMRVEVGAPDQWPSMKGLTINQGSFAAAQAATWRFYWQKSMEAIGKVDDGEWFMSPKTVNAAYSASRNAINFPAAILQAPLFSADFSRAVNAGAMGTIMGHELTHGFDDQGRQFDGDGRLSDWWTKKTEAEFSKRAQCLVQQYDAIEGLPGVNVNGELTLGENIADLGGVKLAYAALDPSSTDARAFFVAYAQGWCENARPDYLATLLRTDPHAPPWVRVNAVLANIPEFAEAFSCSSGAPMAPVKRCEVW
jgi:putative endopeptidase